MTKYCEMADEESGGKFNEIYREISHKKIHLLRSYKRFTNLPVNLITQPLPQIKKLVLISVSSYNHNNKHLAEDIKQHNFQLCSHLSRVCCLTEKKTQH